MSERRLYGTTEDKEENFTGRENGKCGVVSNKKTRISNNRCVS